MTNKQNEDLLRKLYCYFDVKVIKLWKSWQIEIRRRENGREVLLQYIDKEMVELICMWLTENKRLDAEKKPTLRQYMVKHQSGAYHTFVFTIANKEIEVMGVDDFMRLYNPALLDYYEVVNEETKEEGNDCTNYECRHHLILRPRQTKGDK